MSAELRDPPCAFCSGRLRSIWVPLTRSEFWMLLGCSVLFGMIVGWMLCLELLEATYRR